MTQLASTVYVQDPDTRQTVELAAGTNPPARLAVLVTNPAAWVDGKLPTAAKKAQASDGDQESDQGDGSGDASASGSDDAEAAKPAAKKTAARPARGRKSAADEGSSS